MAVGVVVVSLRATSLGLPINARFVLAARDDLRNGSSIVLRLDQ